MKPLIISLSITTVLAFGFLSAGCTKAAISGGMLIKGSTSAVYYVSDDGRRYVFPNSQTYNSWYKDTRQSITKVNDQEIADLPLAGNVTIRPGASLIKITTNPKVYAISAGGYLHWVASEDIARDLYGSDWNTQVIDVPDVFFVNYLIDIPIQNSAAYNRNDAMRYIQNIQQDLNARNNYVSDSWMQADTKKVMYDLTNIFESGDTFPSYGIIELLNDGRGYTSGKSGFTTATSDANLVVKRYTELRPDNELAQYLPQLQKLTDEISDSLEGLSGYSEAWQRSALDPLFRQAQDEISDNLYYIPAMQKADSLGINTALARAFMFDTFIQHGGGYDPDSVYSLIDRTNAIIGGTPNTGISETSWLRIMLDEREKTLRHATDPKTRSVWAVSAFRVNVYRDLLNSGNLNLDTPIIVTANWINAILN